MTNGAEIGFPFERVEAAKRYLYLLKPYWSRFGERLTIVPVYDPPSSGEKYGSITSTDPNFRLYIDRTFATDAPLHELAGAIEHEFQHHTRDTWQRLTFLDPDEWRRWANICLDLEINGAIDAEVSRYTPNGIRLAASRSLVFTERELDRWGVTAPPSLPEVGWVPRLIGLPTGLSAEEYLALLRESEREKEREDAEAEQEEEKKHEGKAEESGGEAASDDPSGSSGDSDQSSSDGGDPEEESEEGEGSRNDEESESDSTSKDESDDSAPENKEPTDGSSNRSPEGDPEAGADEGESDEGEDGDPGDAEVSEAGDAEESDSGEGTEEESADGGPGEGIDQGESADQGEGEGAGESDGSPRDGAEGGQGDPSGSIGSEGSTSSDGGEPSVDSAVLGDGESEGEPAETSIGSGPARKVDELRLDPLNAVWSSELVNPNDPLSNPSHLPKESDLDPPTDSGEIAAAFVELEEDVLRASRGPYLGFGSGPGDRLVEWAYHRRKVRGLDWESRFTRLLSSAVESAKISGSSDLSYSVRNPNQPETGAILMGIHGYAPKVYVLQDVSGSMLNGDALSTAMTVFTDLAAKVLGRFGSEVTWITADTRVLEVGRVTGWDPKLEKKWRGGWGGTGLGPIITEIMRGDFRFRKRRYVRPDLLIVSTDCHFGWPEERPTRAGKILVVNVAPHGGGEDNLPDWIDFRRELVMVTD